MANYRQIHVSIWKDCWFLDLDPKEKLLFIYLFSNSETSMAGIYKISFKVICFETGMAGEFVKEALDRFQEAGKIMYQDGVMWVKNMTKYHSSKSPKIMTGIQNDLDNIPHCEVKIQYLYSINTESQQEQEKELEKEQEQNGVGLIFETFQNEIQMLSVYNRDIINDWIDEYPEDWIIDAIHTAVGANVRKPNYVDGILKNWKTKGRGNKKAKQESYNAGSQPRFQ